MQPNLPHPDDFYEALTGTYRNLDEEYSAILNLQLILLLTNHIGDMAILCEALAAAWPALPTATAT